MLLLLLKDVHDLIVFLIPAVFINDTSFVGRTGMAPLLGFADVDGIEQRIMTGLSTWALMRRIVALLIVLKHGVSAGFSRQGRKELLDIFNKGGGSAAGSGRRRTGR